MFEVLRLVAGKNVETFNALIGEKVAELAEFDKTFSVVRHFHGKRLIVRFNLGDDAIHVEAQGLTLHMIAGLTLNDHGECRLLVDDKELDQWQFLKRAREPLFFYRENYGRG
jgi:hypothetical protein